MNKLLGLVVGLFAFVFLSPLAHAQVELKNDSFVDGGPAGFQQGFVTSEIAASRFDAPAASQQLLKVTMLYGGVEGATRNVVLRIYADTAGGGAAPGAQIFEGEFQLTSSNTAMQELDVSGENIMVPETFRVGIEFESDGLPSVARDDDGIDATHNFIRVAGGQWFGAQTLGVMGDWILRATVADQGGTSSSSSASSTSASTGASTGDTSASATTTATSGSGGTTGPGGSTGGPGASSASGAGGGSGNACEGNGDCVPYQYCSASKVCTFDCRADDDCGGGATCNSLGQCVDGESSGCDCRAGGDAGEPWEAGVAFVGLILGAGVFAARRSKR